MATERPNLRSIKTLSKLLDGRRARTPAGALLEMSAMANEKLLLTKELERGNRRRAEIDSRLAEIHAKSERLLAFVQNPAAAVAEPARVANGPESPVPPTATPAAPPALGRFKTTELNY
ncbi:MAG: hypothetical protein P4L84_27835 [Isosphaeraceae bacterium]|nr:hypothetical protein [Isosphaeraceae bacterium]